MELRYINKTFYCYNCSTRFKKLVTAEENVTSCTNCNFGFAQLLEEGEFNRENLDRTYRLQFNNGIANNQYHPVTDVFDRDPQNIYGDPRSRVSPSGRVRSPTNQTTQTNQTNQNNQTTQGSANTQNVNSGRTNGQARRPRVFTFNQNPFNSMFFSPFTGSVNRQAPGFNINNMFNAIFVMPVDEVFMDNFSSNFNSNFEDPLTRIIFIQSMNENQPQGKPPASKQAVRNLKRFKMSEEYCKKDDKGKLEYPTCSVCMSEIQQNNDTTLIPCGHLYHDNCVSKWFDMNNSCPVCRYELPTDDPDYEANRNNTSTRNNSVVNRQA
jgi:hypothetical protein